MIISNVSISPQIAAANETVNVTCKVTMGSGENASGGVYLYLENAAGGVFGINSDNSALGAGKSRSYSFSCTVWPLGNSVRGERLGMLAEAYGGGDTAFFARLPNVLTYLEAWRTPSIAALSARRFLNGVPSPVGTQAAVSLRAALKPGAASGGMACTLSYKRVSDAEYSQPVSVSVGAALAGITDNTALLSALSMELGSEYDVLAYFGDAFESAKQRFRIAKAHTKFSVSKNAPGVSVGQHSTATPASPKFECQYPAYLYGGVPQFNYATSRVDTKLKWTDGKAIYRKVLAFGTVNANSTVDVSTGESAIAEVVHIRGMFKPTGETARAPIPWSHYSSAANQFQMVVYNLTSNPYVRLRTGSGQSANSGHIIIEYTLP